MRHDALVGSRRASAILWLLVVSAVWVAHADESIGMKKTAVKGSSELPKYLYVVPWRDKTKSFVPEKKLRLHNLYGDLFDPIKPQYRAAIDPRIVDSKEVPPVAD